MPIVLRETSERDLDLVLEIEGDPGVAPYMVRLSREEQREAILSEREERLLVVEDGEVVGTALLSGIGGRNDSIEIRRVAITRRGRGLGRRALELVVDRAFDRHGAHRVWLDTQPGNERALRAYAAVGFVRDGVLREAIRFDDRHVSVVVLSIVEGEWRQRGRETAAR